MIKRFVYDGYSNKIEKRNITLRLLFEPSGSEKTTFIEQFLEKNLFDSKWYKINYVWEEGIQFIDYDVGKKSMKLSKSIMTLLNPSICYDVIHITHDK